MSIGNRAIVLNCQLLMISFHSLSSLLIFLLFDYDIAPILKSLKVWEKFHQTMVTKMHSTPRMQSAFPFKWHHYKLLIIIINYQSIIHLHLPSRVLSIKTALLLIKSEKCTPYRQQNVNRNTAQRQIN